MTNKHMRNPFVRVGPSFIKPVKHHSRDKCAGPVAFCREQLGFTPDPKQAGILRENHRRLLVNCSGQWGKSTVTAAKAVYIAMTQPESLVLIASPTERQSGEFVRKVKTFMYRLGIRPRGDGYNSISVQFPNGSRIIGLPGENDGNIRGFSGVSLLVIDEASRVNDTLYHAARPMVIIGEGDIWLLSTPCGKRGFFYEEWTNGGDLWNRVSVPATECPRISAELLEEERRILGEDMFNQEFMCRFVDGNGAIFDRELVELAFSKFVPRLEIKEDICF
jgi:hypothetical protein